MDEKTILYKNLKQAISVTFEKACKIYLKLTLTNAMLRE